MSDKQNLYTIAKGCKKGIRLGKPSSCGGDRRKRTVGKPTMRDGVGAWGKE